jgi:hypothetical protein
MQYILKTKETIAKTRTNTVLKFQINATEEEKNVASNVV